MPIFIKPNAVFEIGKADVIQEGSDVTIIACGHMVWKSIEAAQTLAAMGVSVELINMHTIKPIDEKAILKSAAKTKCLVTAEEHMANGGLGEAVARVLAANTPCPQEFIAVNDSFGESGKPMDLMEKYGLGASHIHDAALKAHPEKSLNLNLFQVTLRLILFLAGMCYFHNRKYPSQNILSSLESPCGKK